MQALRSEVPANPDMLKLPFITIIVILIGETTTIEERRLYSPSLSLLAATQARRDRLLLELLLHSLIITDYLV